jgi:hypothetical protein
MKTSNRLPLILALAIPLMVCMNRPANAQATDAQVQAFASSAQSLTSWLAQTAGNDPNQQALVNDLQQALNNLTPSQMQQLASSYNIAAFTNAVNAVVAVPAPAATVSPTTAPADPPANLFPPNFGICSLVSSAQQGTGLQLVPSDPNVIKALDVGIAIAKEATAIANAFCGAVVVVAGEGTTLPQCIVAQVTNLIQQGLQRAREILKFCDPVASAAETEATWHNSITIDSDLANHDANVSSHLTQIDNHLTTIDNDLAAHSSALGTDVDSHVTAVNVDIDNRVASVDADLNNRITGTDTDLNTHLTGVDTDLLNRATQIDNEISTFQALDLRLKIEHALAAGLTIGLFEVPTAQGGDLDLVRSIVVDTINKVLASGGTVGTASKSLTTGDNARAAGQFKSAYSNYESAYQAAVH